MCRRHRGLPTSVPKPRQDVDDIEQQHFRLQQGVKKVYHHIQQKVCHPISLCWQVRFLVVVFLPGCRRWPWHQTSTRWSEASSCLRWHRHPRQTPAEARQRGRAGSLGLTRPASTPEEGMATTGRRPSRCIWSHWKVAQLQTRVSTCRNTREKRRKCLTSG